MKKQDLLNEISSLSLTAPELVLKAEDRELKKYEITFYEEDSEQKALSRTTLNAYIYKEGTEEEAAYYEDNVPEMKKVRAKN